MLIGNNLFSLTEGLFACKAHCQYKEHIKDNLSKYWIKDLTGFKPLVERIRNNIIPLIAVIRTDLDELKAYVVIAVKLIGKLNMLLIAF